MRTALFTGFAFVLAVVPACGTDLEGDGVPLDATLEVGPFHAVTVENRLPVTIAVRPMAGASVQIHGDDNLVPLIDVRVDGGRLHLGVSGGRGIAPREPLRIVVSAAAIDDVLATGGSTVSAGGIDGASVRIESSGSSAVTVAGASTTATLIASGGSSLDARALDTGTVHVDWSGRSLGNVRARELADGSASGASSLDVYGAPAKRSVEVSGGAVVTFR
jgi:hypothetical protein